LLEGRWEITLSNDVNIKHPLTVEIHGDGSFRLLGRKRAFAFSQRIRRAGLYDITPVEEGGDSSDSSIDSSTGSSGSSTTVQLVLFPPSQHLESVAGISLPLPEPSSPPTEDIVPLLEEDGGEKEGGEVLKTKNVRITLEDRDTIILVFEEVSSK